MARNHIHEAAYDNGFLKVSDIHTLHYEQYGKLDGKPVIFLHGGPGGSTSIGSTAFFDPAVYRVVLFDQRGAGRSTPLAELRDNTSQHLVADIEVLRIHLGIPKWHLVFGGSWGSTLALLYAQAHPDVVGSLVLRGVFTGRKEEIVFSRGSSGGCAMLFPGAFETYLNHLAPEDRCDPEAGYYKLMQRDAETRKAAAREFARWDLTTSTVDVARIDWTKLDDEQWCYTHSMLICHYLLNALFIEEGELFREENMEKIRHIPGIIIQGRLDLTCPLKTAWDLHKAWPGSKLYMIPGAGHKDSDPGIRTKLIEACDEFAALDLI